MERFYRALPPPVTIGIETTGYPQWFHGLMHQLGHTVVVGEAAKIRAMVVRKTKTDRRDARHRLDLLQHDRFPTVWIPDPDTRDRRALIAHRVRPPLLQLLQRRLEQLPNLPVTLSLGVARRPAFHRPATVRAAPRGV